MNDFSHLKKEEEILLGEIVKGLEENGVDWREVVGGKEVGLGGVEGLEGGEGKADDRGEYLKLSNQQIIHVQTMLIDKLAKQLKLK